MKGKKHCMNTGGKAVSEAAKLDSADGEYKHGGRTKYDMPMMGDKAKHHLGRGIRGKFAMGGVVKHPTDDRMKE